MSMKIELTNHEKFKIDDCGGKRISVLRHQLLAIPVQ